MLPANRHFKMPEPLAWFANLLGVAYVILTTVLFVFPPAIPVSGTSMNYCIVAFAIVVIISLIQWIVDGRKNYTGPKVDLDADVLNAVDAPVNAVNGSGEHSNSGEFDEKEKHV